MRIRLASIVIVVATVAAVAGWVAATQLTTPVQSIVDQAQQRAVITAQVELTALQDSLVTRGEVTIPGEIEVSAPPVAEGIMVVSRILVDQMDEVLEGEQLMEISGRPVFLLTGDTPQYRSLFPLLNGDDVLQLQQALRRLGLYDGDLDGVFGPSTEAAVATLYNAHGYEPRLSDDNIDQLIAAAELRVSTAEGQVKSSTQALTNTTLARVEAIKAAQAAVNNAENQISAVTLATNAAIAEAQLALTQAEDRLDRAQNAPEPDPDEIAVAEADVLNAINALAAADLDRDIQIETATDELEIASGSLELAKAMTTTDAQNALIGAAAELETARAEMTLIIRSNGAGIPLGEIVFVPVASVTVIAVHAVEGTPAAEGPLLTLAAAAPEVRVSVPPIAVSLVSEGMDALVYVDDGNEPLKGWVENVVDTGGEGSEGAAAVVAIVQADGLVRGQVGLNLRVDLLINIEAESLVVPLPAVWSQGSSSTFVTRLSGTVREDIEVQVGSTAGGMVAIADPEGRLKPGDTVIVSE